MSISTLFSIDGEVVFYSPTIHLRRYEFWNKLLAGEVQAVDIWGNVMQRPSGSIAFATICDRAAAIGHLKADAILANVLMYPILTALIRSELDGLSLEYGAGVLQKMSGVLTTLAAGMFTLAAGMIQALEPDEFLTEERIRRYATMVNSCNACP